MIKYYKGSLFDLENCDAIVNTVNCEGFMGRGIALEFKIRYPEMYYTYKEDCNQKKYRPGSVHLYKLLDNNIINFATKDKARYFSQIEWIEKGLKELIVLCEVESLKEVALPMLGTSNGGLNSKHVLNLMENELRDALNTNFTICLDEEILENSKEDKMLKKLNMTNFNALTNIKLTQVQRSLIEKCKPYSRVRNLMFVNGISPSTYGKIINFLDSDDEIMEQTTLF